MLGVGAVCIAGIICLAILVISCSLLCKAMWVNLVHNECNVMDTHGIGHSAWDIVGYPTQFV